MASNRSTLVVRDRGYASLMRRIKKPFGGVVTVGVHSGEGGDPKRVLDNRTGQVATAKGITVAQVAEAHEFGLGVPQRSWLASWFDGNQKRIHEQIRYGCERWLFGEKDSRGALDLIGVQFVGDVQRRIRDNKIQPETGSEQKARKAQRGTGENTTLIDTGQLWTSIKHRIQGALGGR